MSNVPHVTRLVFPLYLPKKIEGQLQVPSIMRPEDYELLEKQILDALAVVKEIAIFTSIGINEIGIK